MATLRQDISECKNIASMISDYDIGDKFNIESSSLYPLIQADKTLDQYNELVSQLAHCCEAEQTAIRRFLCRTDLFFLIWHECKRKDMFKPWLLERCKEVQANPNGNLDLWARDHYKSTIITFGKSIQDILSSHGDDPLPAWNGREVTIGIFSCTRPLAKGFLVQIKREFEANELMRADFADILWENPSRDAPKWSEDSGLIVKRKSNPKESTIEAWGVVDGQPTGKHFFGRVYDDIITLSYVTSPDMINKVTGAWELSTNLGTEGGYERYIGTRYHFNDTYRELMARGTVKVRLYTPYDDGTFEGNPVLKSREELDKKRRDQGPYTFACQMMQNPVADEKSGFRREWLQYHESKTRNGLNVYLLVDPANAKKSTSDYSVFLAVGIGADGNRYILDIVRDRLNLGERSDMLFTLHRKWKPLAVGYEQYGMQADIQYVKKEMARLNYRFNITELGGKISKVDRIRALIPLFEQRKVLLPETCHKTNYQGQTQDLVEIFREEEYTAFPVPVHDDMLDCLARIEDPAMKVEQPKEGTSDISKITRKRKIGVLA